MYDHGLLLEILEQTEQASRTVLERFEVVESMDYLIDTPEGREKLDALCMQLIAIGESLKKIDKLTDQTLLRNYPEVDWKGAKGIRDVISHHYFDLDAEEIYHTCDTQLPDLHYAIQNMINTLTENK